MSLSPGTRLGQYEVIAPLGSGGMGDVYRARDSRLGRDVAIKSLPDRFLHDSERLQRFEREAQILASLSHPNLATIYQLERHGDSTYLILELIEGPTLADRLAAGPLPLDEALDVARQMADGLEAAHDRGIVHRDLKPANIKLSPEGRVKILDFGLAKIFEPRAATADATQSPTFTALNTGVGVILGTAAYMSPEQARGRSVDRRSDMWSFGCVLYEMLAGRQAFRNEESVSDTLATILKGDVDWTALPAGIPPRIRLLLERCLRKDPRRRLGDAAAARLEIEEAGAESPPGLVAPLPAPPVRRYAWPAVAVVSTLMLGALAVWIAWRRPAEAPLVRFDVFSIDGTPIQIGEPLSPDGRTIAFVAGPEGNVRLWVRRLDSTVVRPLEGTEGAQRPFWSPDSTQIGFFAGGRLKRVPAAGGPVVVIADEEGRGGAWNVSGTILIGGGRKGVLRVSETGGPVEPETVLQGDELTHEYPQFLPDGRHYLYLARAGPTSEAWTLYAGTLGSRDRVAIEGVHAGVHYSLSGHLLFSADGTLMAQPFDAVGLRVTGPAVPVAPGSNATAPSFSVSKNGTLAFLSGASISESRPAWFARDGRQLGFAAPVGEYRSLDLSPDGSLLAFDRGAPGDVYVLNLARSGQAVRLTTDDAADAVPVWSPDARRVLFQSSRNPVGNNATNNLAGGNLWVAAYGAVAGETEFHRSAAGKTPNDWSSHGYLAYVERNDIWVLSTAPGAKPIQLTRTPANESNAQISPDGRWIAYNALEAGGQTEVFVQAFPAPGVRQQVSARGGWLPRWSSDGSELFYFEIGQDPTLMAAPITVAGADLRAGTSVRLFPARLPSLSGYRAFEAAAGARSYDVAPGGRFLINTVTAERSAPLTVVYNWAQSLRSK